MKKLKDCTRLESDNDVAVIVVVFLGYMKSKIQFSREENKAIDNTVDIIKEHFEVKD